MSGTSIDCLKECHFQFVFHDCLRLGSEQIAYKTQIIEQLNTLVQRLDMNSLKQNIKEKRLESVSCFLMDEGRRMEGNELFYDELPQALF